MRERIAAWSARGRRCVFRLRHALAASLVLVVMGAVGAPADLQRGLAWLQAQVQADGTLPGQPSAGAQQQAQCEAAATLAQLVANSPQVAPLLAALQQNADGTEALGCVQRVRQILGQATAAGELNARRVAPAGYAAFAGATSASVIDSGWALETQLGLLSAGERGAVIDWLGSQQAASGSFAAHGRPDILTTAAVLRALRTEASRSSAAASIATAASGWLLSARSAPGHWHADVAMTAIAFEALHPYTAGEAGMAQAVETFLLGRQDANGSWAGDAQTTSVALRALALTAQSPIDPTRAALRARFLDARTGTPVPGVRLESAAPAATVLSAADGTARLLRLAPGNYQFVASLGGYASVGIPASLQAGQDIDLGDIQLVAPLTGTSAVISGVVREAGSNAPVPGAQVQIEGRASAAVSLGDGRYLMPDVTPGSVAITVSRPGFLGASMQATAVAGQVLHYSPYLVADPSGSGSTDCKVIGTVVHGLTGQPLAGTVIEVTGSATASATADAMGRYATSNLVSGQLTVTATRPGFDPISAATQIWCSPLRSTALAFSPRLYPTGQSPVGANASAIAGVVIDAATNTPVVGAQLVVRPSFGLPRNGTVGLDGAFSFDGLNGDSAQLHVQASGYRSTTLTYALAPLEKVDVGQVRLQPAQSESLLPDLTVLSVGRSGVTVHAQTLALAGIINAEVANLGNVTAPGSTVRAFFDANRNGRWDVDVDVPLGVSTAASLLPTATQSLSITVQGIAAFRDAPIHVAVDPDGQVVESKKDNNVRSSSDGLRSNRQRFFQPRLKWEWTSTTDMPDHVHVIGIPVTGRMLDTNLDGIIDRKDEVTVVFTSHASYADYSAAANGVLRIISGKDGRELRTLGHPDLRVSPMAEIAIADLDADGAPEIIAVASGGHHLLAVSATGAIKWRTQLPKRNGGGWPTVADLDGDGAPEVVLGNWIFSNTGVLKSSDPSGYDGDNNLNSNRFGFNALVRSAAAVDLDLSGTQSIVVGASAYSASGALKWRNTSVGEGLVAIGNFNEDDYPEIVVVHGSPSVPRPSIQGFGYVSLLNRLGQRIWGPVQLPELFNDGIGGPPVIADFDGDGSPDIGVAGRSRYTVLSGDGVILWEKSGFFDQSSQTGSSLFDFDGDGKAEIVYADQRHLRAMAASDGRFLFATPNSSATNAEYPLVVDVDDDGHADVVVASNDWPVVRPPTGPYTHGIRVFQDDTNSWVGVRSVWNQHAYSITNIQDDLKVPRQPEPSWLKHNSYRLNKQIEGDPLAVADLTVGYLRVADGGAGGSVLTVRVGSAGSLPTPPNLRLAIYAADPAAGQPPATAIVATATIAQPLQPGQWIDLQIPVARSLASLNALGRIWIVGDDDGTGQGIVADFDRANNVHAGDLPALAANVLASVATDKPAYLETDLAVLTATGLNLGSFPRDAQARFALLDAAGRVIDTLPLTAASSVPAGGTAQFGAVLPLQGLLAGVYTVRAELVAPDGFVYGAATTTFSLSASQASAAFARIATDRATYTSLQPVQILTRAGNHTANTVLQNLQARTEVIAAGGAVVFSQAAAIDQLAPTVTRSLHYVITATALPAGSYTARVQLSDAQAAVLAQSTATFTVQSTGQSGAGLSGTLTVAPASVFIGEPVQLSLQVRNASSAAMPSAPATIRLVRPLDLAVVGTVVVTLPELPAGAVRTVTASWPAAGAHGETLLAGASLATATGQVSLGQASVQLVGVPGLQATPGTLVFTPVTAGASVTRTVTLTASGTAPVISPSYSLAGQDASQFALPQGGCAAGASLPVQGTCTLTVSYRPDAVGAHAAEVRVGYGAGAVLTVPLQASAVAPDFTGTLAVSRSEVEPGGNLQLLYSVSNPAGITSSFAGSLSVQSAAGQAVGQWPLSLDVGPNAAVALSQALAAPAQTGAYHAALGQSSPSGSRVLATATFAVVDAAPQVSLEAAPRPGHARILVLLSCPVGNHGNDDAACVAQRAGAITSYLAGLGIPAKVVSTQQAFRDEMRCGTYNTYWITGGSQKLDDQLVAEVREAVTRGEALVVDGVHDSRNKLLHPVLGVKQNGKLPHAGHTIAFASGGLYAPGTLGTAGQPTKFDLESSAAVAQARFTEAQGNQAPSPAIVSHAWGAGRTLLFAFDLVGTLQADPGQANAVLRQMLLASATHLAGGTTTLTIGDLASVGASLHNQGSRTFALRVEATLPVGVTATSSLPPAAWTAQADGSWRGQWTVSLAPGATQDVALQLRASAAGSHVIRMAVYPSVGTVPLAEQDVVLAVRDGPLLLLDAANAVGALAPSHNSDKNDKAKAVQAVADALALHQQGRFDQALAKWVAAADAVARIGSADTTAARLAVALAMEASTDALCLQRCGSAVCQ